MRTLWMVVVVMLLAVSAVGCRKRVTVIVPNTPDGLKCERECMQVFHACQAGNGKNAKVCREEGETCRQTCPGAMFSDGRPARGAIASGVSSVPPPANEEAKAVQEDSAPRTEPVRRPSCVASELPEWQGADAATKKKLMEQCRAPANP